MAKRRGCGFIPPARLLFCLLLLNVSASAQSLPSEQESLRVRLRAEAGEVQLWKNPYWLRLLYYEKSLFGGYRSPSVDPAFFLSPKGRSNPEAELASAIDGFFVSGTDDDSPECRFPERYRWLREKLRPLEKTAPPRICKSFEDWKAAIDPESVSLLFAAGYLNNPSTLYGHTFLRIHKRGANGADLLDYTLNYAATTDEEGGVLFALRGLIGAYPGRFSTVPYYLKIQEYHNLENRDLWEFPLGLSKDAIDRLMRHAWELGKAAFPYYFFTRNCSWQLMPLLDIAEPSLNLASRFHLWVIPSDTARAAVDATGAAVRPVWRPSLWKTVEWKRALLSPRELELAARLARGRQSEAFKELGDMPPIRQAAALEAAADYLSWRFYARRIVKTELEERSGPVLAARAALGAQDTFSGTPLKTLSIRSGHESMRVGLGAIDAVHGPLTEFQWRFAMQDLLDCPDGYLPDAALEMGALKIRYDKRYNRTYFKEAKLAHVLSLNPWDDWVRRQSWEITAGIEQAEEKGRQRGTSAIWSMNAGAGAAVETHLFSRQLWYVLAVADTGFGDALDKMWRAGAGPKAGVLAGAGPLRALFEVRYLSYAFGDTAPLWTGTAAASLKLSRDSALRLEYSWRGHVKETGLVYQRFFFPP
ncbi:MAG: hypothetical protein A2270_01350 [Elusimicrobia bacterium RIFOXYA12_FULL_51_18]|nr:MAG: hypothetical protein A2270_01350 [Elusimicrobia bacterium RIFOXYA12_FULL_51_18]OGS30023.1 MAG: hypothetical protein A2218_12795 [Elusimicrobia bacterium RIFOXYA2_FULL_53_38]